MESIADTRRLLTINTGSSSLKAALYHLGEDATVTLELRAGASRIGGRGSGMRLADDGGETLDERRDDLLDHAAALDALMSRLRDRGLDRDYLAAVGHRIVHVTVDVDRFYVRGFNEQGTTTTPFNMVVLIGMSRYHLAASGLRPGDRAPTLISECEAAIARATAYSREHFEDPPEISNWTWTL